MSNRFIKLSLLVLLILAFFTVFPWIEDKISEKGSKKVGDVSVNLSVFTKENVNKISFKKGNDEVLLSLENNIWKVGESKADEEKVNQLFQAFSELRVKEMVSNNENNWIKFGTTKDNGIQLTIIQNDKSSTFFVGKAGPAIDDFYLRKEGIKNVYLVNGKLREKLSWKIEDWGASSENQK